MSVLDKVSLYGTEYDVQDSTAVHFTEQTIDGTAQAQARTNIGAAATADIPTSVVRYAAQTLEEAQKTQARDNIFAEKKSYTEIPLSSYTTGKYVYAGSNATTISMSGGTPVLSDSANARVWMQECQEGDRFTIYGIGPGTNCKLCLFADTAGHILAMYGKTTVEVVSQVVTAPQNAAWVIFHKWSSGTAANNAISIGASTTVRLDTLEKITTNVPYLDAAVDTMAYSENIYDISTVTWEDGTINSETGAEEDSTSYKRSSRIPVDSARDALNYFRTNTGYTLAARFFTANNSYIGGEVVYTANTESPRNNRMLPGNAAYMRLVCSKESVREKLTISYSNLTGHIAYGTRYLVYGAVPPAAVGTVLANRVAPSGGLAKGDYFVLDGKLCKAKSVIASGTVFTASVYDKVTLASELASVVTVDETVTGVSGAFTIAAEANHRYICSGTLSSISFTPCATGFCEVVFTTGSTPLWDDQTGAVMPGWWPDSNPLQANCTYEMSFSDKRGAVMAWPT